MRHVHDVAPSASRPSRGGHDSLTLGYLCPGWPPDSHPNGIVTSVAAVTGGLRRAGHHPHILVRMVSNSADDATVHEYASPSRDGMLKHRLLHALRSRLGPKFGMADAQVHAIRLGILRLAAEQGVRLVEMEESFGWAEGVQRLLHLPIVVRLHGPWFLTGPSNGVVEDAEFRKRVQSEGRAIAAAFAVSSPSHDVLDRTRAHYGLPLKAAEVIPNPAPTCPASDRWRPEDCDPNLILFIGRFDRIKGGDVVIDAFDRVLRKVPDARLQFAGPDRGIIDDDGRAWSVADYIRARAPEGSAAGRIEFLGQRPHATLATLRRKAAVVVACSRYENFPTTVLEAGAQGCPLVASRAGGIPEIIQDDVNGLLCGPGDPDELAGYLIRLLNDRGLAERLGRQVGIDCERMYHPDVVAARMVEFYRRVLARWERRGGKSPS